MAETPSPAQRRLLDEMAAGSSLVWIGGIAPWAYLNIRAERLPIRTVMALRDRGWIVEKKQGYGRCDYAISPTGREALERSRA